ncbi:MAG: hypothetical protein ACRC5N_07885, partial [Plesiomonas sp.]
FPGLLVKRPVRKERPWWSLFLFVFLDLCLLFVSAKFFNKNYCTAVGRLLVFQARGCILRRIHHQSLIADCNP